MAHFCGPARELFCLSSSSLMKVELLLLLLLERGYALWLIFSAVGPHYPGVHSMRKVMCFSPYMKH